MHAPESALRRSRGVALVLAPVLAAAACAPLADDAADLETATTTTTAALTAPLVSIAAGNDASTATFTLGYSGTHTYFHVFVDSDRDPGTGLVRNGVGADFLLENGRFYRYAGDGKSWVWSHLDPPVYANSGTVATWRVPRAALGETNPCAESADLVFDVDGVAAPKLTQLYTAASSCAVAPTPAPAPAPAVTPTSGGAIKHVFVISMENESSTAIYGSARAPYINGELIPRYARSTAFTDPLADGLPSEPHYIWMEAGRNAFSDYTFTTDADPSATNSTGTVNHLVTQMRNASPAVSWLSFQEGLDPATTGACPVRSAGLYVARHDPFVFFRDVAGSPPAKDNAYCADHHRAYTPASFAQALQQGAVAQYNFITPNKCNDMHGGTGCTAADNIAAGDQWLRANLPPIIDFANSHGGVIFIVWDEPVGGSTLVPFLAIGPGVKRGYAGAVPYNHGSLTKSVERIFRLPLLPAAAGTNDFADLFVAGAFP